MEQRHVNVMAPKKPTEICAVDYCKRYGEHGLAVKIVDYRKRREVPHERPEPSDFMDDLMDLIHTNNDVLLNY